MVTHKKLKNFLKRQLDLNLFKTLNTYSEVQKKLNVIVSCSKKDRNLLAKLIYRAIRKKEI